MGIVNSDIKDFTFIVDTITKNSLCVADVKQEDSNVIFYITVTKRGEAVNLTGMSLTLFVRKPDGKLVFQDKDITILDAAAGKIRINMKASAFQSVGVVVANLDFRISGQYFTSANFFFHVGEKIGNNDAVKSEVDVPLFWQISDYINFAVKQIEKYKALFEAFVAAGVSLQGLNDIKKYIDNNLSELKFETDEAVALIPQVNKARTDAEAKRVEVVNTTNSAEAKRVQVVAATNSAEAKRVEVVNTTNTANTSKTNLETATTNANTKKVEVETATANAEKKRLELVGATNTANTSKTNLETAINNAETKRGQVVTVTNNAEAKRKELQGVIDAVGNAGVVTAEMLASEMGKKVDKTGGVATNLAFGGADAKIYSAGTGTSYVELAPKLGTAEPLWANALRYFYNEGAWCIGTTAQKIYHQGFKPTPAEIGASPSSHNHDTKYLPLSGGSIDGRVTDTYNSGTTIDNTLYNKLSFEARSGDGGVSGIGFHRVGKSAIGLYTQGNEAKNLLRIRSSSNGDYDVYHSGNKPTPAEIGAISTADYEVGLNGILKSISGTDIRSINKSGRYMGSACPNAPSTGWWFFDIEVHNTKYKKIMAKEFYTNLIWTCSQIDGVWSAWVKVYTTDFKPTAADIGALNSTGGTITGDLNVQRNLQVGGIGVVSSGANSDGSVKWVRFYDGTQICWGENVHSSGDFDMTSQTVTGVYGGMGKNISFPVTFTTKPSVSVQAATNSYTNSQATGVTTTLFLARAWGNCPATVTHLYFNWLAIGRWK